MRLECGSLLPWRGVFPSASKLAHSKRTKTRGEGERTREPKASSQSPARGYARPPSASSRPSLAGSTFLPSSGREEFFHDLLNIYKYDRVG